MFRKFNYFEIFKQKAAKAAFCFPKVPESENSIKIRQNDSALLASAVNNTTFV